jgi:Listeria-Bacteroides repeat domain (List_Bact_rpt)
MFNLEKRRRHHRRPLRVIIISIMSLLLALSFVPSRASSKVTCPASKVIFVPNGDDVNELRSGSNVDAEIRTVCAVNGVVTVPNFSRLGYTLSRWTGEPDVGSEETITALIGNPKTFTTSVEATRAFAQWEPIQYSVSYNYNGGSGSASAANSMYLETIYVGATISNDVYSFTTPTRDGYRFLGWSFNGNTYAPGSLIDAPASNVVFMAVWVSA